MIRLIITGGDAVKKLVLVAGGIALLAIAWFLLSPLFIDEVVDEDLIVRVPQMTSAERSAKKAQIMRAAANMPDKNREESMPQNEPTLLMSGKFVDADAVHKGSGEAKIYKLADDSHVVRLENFRVTNGPDLAIYLVEHHSPKSANDVSDTGFLNLGKLKGNVGNQNYVVPNDADLSQYHSVVIWCELFGVLFSPAALSAY